MYADTCLEGLLVNVCGHLCTVPLWHQCIERGVLSKQGGKAASAARLTFYELQQLVGTTKLCLDLKLVPSPVTMVTAGEVVHHRRDPYRIKPHAFDVIHLVENP